MASEIINSNLEYLTLREATAIVPGRPHLATLWRWATKGVRGQRLQTRLVGGQRFVSRQAIEDFLGRLNPDAAPVAQASTPRQRERAIAAAERELDAAGI